MGPDNIHFDSIKESRDWYFVEYRPPIPTYKFSLLELVVMESRDIQDVAAAMEKEAKHWLARYPVPLMATAFSKNGDVFPLMPARPVDHLMAWPDITRLTEVLRWEAVPDNELPDVALDQKWLRQVFSSIPSKTGQQLKAEANKDMVSQRVGWWFVFLWAIVVPLAVEIIEWWSELLGTVVVGYAVCKAAIEALRLTGKLPKSKRAEEKEAKELKMQHYYYHCERNPEAFMRLKLENFEREEIERTENTAKALKASKEKE